MIPINQALETISKETKRLGSESVALSDTVGRVLAEDIRADMDLPPFDRSQMDGFAVKAADVKKVPATLRIAGESAAGRGWHDELKSGEAVRIMTGAPVPAGADSVQIVELTHEAEGFVEIRNPTEKGQNIVRKSDEMVKGTTVFETGEIITGNMIATLASFGYASVRVSKHPRVSILSTGSEIVDVAEKPGRDQIRNSNSSMLAEFARNYAEVEVLPIAADDLDSLRQTIETAAASCDVLIISGGVSVGDYDFTKPALREMGATIFFEKVSLKPGKPTVFARFGDTLIFGLPGNPVSIAVTFFVFVRRALMLLQGAVSPGLKQGFARLSHSIKETRGRDALLPVSLKTDDGGTLLIETLRFSGSSNFVAFARADALVFVPADEGLAKGSVAQIYFL